jgi:NAD(P)-dependent dehydrogenase (short-subunit alcohol dehydrogenase family)
VLAGFSLKNKTAIVTGATGLLGRHHAEALAQAGATVIVTDLSHKRCEALAEELFAKFDTQSFGFAANITDPRSLVLLRDEALRRYGAIDVLINNAAIDDVFRDSSEESRFENYQLESWQRCLNVNLTGTFLCCQIIGTEMARIGAGSIINVASTYAIVAPDQSIYRKPDGTQAFYKSVGYPVSKAGVLGLTRFLATYWGSAGVRVNALSPGGVENSQEDYFIDNYRNRTPIGRMAKPDDYRGAIVFLASDASSYMTGANLVVDGGWSVW